MWQRDPAFDVGRLRSLTYQKNVAYGNFIKRVREIAKSDYQLRYIGLSVCP